MYADYKLYRVFEATPVPLPPNERVRIILPPISRPIYRNLSQSIYRDLSVAIYLSIYHDLSRLLYHTMILFNVVDAALLMMILFLLLTRPVLAWTIRLLLIASSLASVRSLRSLSSFDARSNPKTYCLPLNPNPQRTQTIDVLCLAGGVVIVIETKITLALVGSSIRFESRDRASDERDR